SASRFFRNGFQPNALPLPRQREFCNESGEPFESGGDLVRPLRDGGFAEDTGLWLPAIPETMALDGYGATPAAGLADIRSQHPGNDPAQVLDPGPDGLACDLGGRLGRLIHLLIHDAVDPRVGVGALEQCAEVGPDVVPELFLRRETAGALLCGGRGPLHHGDGAVHHLHIKAHLVAEVVVHRRHVRVRRAADVPHRHPPEPFAAKEAGCRLDQPFPRGVLGHNSRLKRRVASVMVTVAKMTRNARSPAMAPKPTSLSAIALRACTA